MTETDNVQVYVRLHSKTDVTNWFAHPELRPKLVADAHERGVNLTDVALRIVCEALEVEYEPNGRRTAPKSSSDHIIVTMPRWLRTRLELRYGKGYVGGIRQILCDHYGLEPGERVLDLTLVPAA